MRITPKKLFLIDCGGALLSAFLLGIVLARFENTFGMPRNVLHPLAIVALIFASYSFTGYLLAKKNWKLYLKVIASANLLYCLLTVGLVLYFYDGLTGFGLLYFFSEVGIIIILSGIEFKTAFSIVE